MVVYLICWGNTGTVGIQSLNNFQTCITSKTIKNLFLLNTGSKSPNHLLPLNYIWNLVTAIVGIGAAVTISIVFIDAMCLTITVTITFNMTLTNIGM